MVGIEGNPSKKWKIVMLQFQPYEARYFNLFRECLAPLSIYVLGFDSEDLQGVDCDN